MHSKIHNLFLDSMLPDQHSTSNKTGSSIQKMLPVMSQNKLSKTQKSLFDSMLPFIYFLLRF